MSQDPRHNCPACGGTFRQRPYDIGSGPEVACPHCEMCFGTEGQPLKPLDLSAVNAELEDLGLLPRGVPVGTLYFTETPQVPTEGEAHDDTG